MVYRQKKTIEECNIDCYIENKVPICKDFCFDGDTNKSFSCEEGKTIYNIETCNNKEFTTVKEEILDCNYTKTTKIDDNSLNTKEYGCTDNNLNCIIKNNSEKYCDLGNHYNELTDNYECNINCKENETKEEKGCTDDNMYLDAKYECKNDLWKIIELNSRNCNYETTVCSSDSNWKMSYKRTCIEDQGCKNERTVEVCELGCADEFSCKETCEENHHVEYYSCENNNAIYVIETCENGIIKKNKSITSQCSNEIDRSCNNGIQKTITNKCVINNNLEAICEDQTTELGCTCVQGFEDTKGYCKERCDEYDSPFTENKCNDQGDIDSITRKCGNNSWVVHTTENIVCDSYRNYSCEDSTQTHIRQTCSEGECKKNTYIQECNQTYGCANQYSCDSECGILDNNLERCIDDEFQTYIQTYKEECINGEKIIIETKKEICPEIKIKCDTHDTIYKKELIGCMAGTSCRYRTTEVTYGHCPITD